MAAETGVGFREWRLAMHKSQSQVARDLGVTQQTVANWDNGRSRPTLALMGRLEEVYGLREGDVVWGKDKD